MSSSDCSVLLLCSVWWSEESMSQENELDSMSNTAALPSLSHKLVSWACSEGGSLFEATSNSPALEGNHGDKHVKRTVCHFSIYINTELNKIIINSTPWYSTTKMFTPCFAYFTTRSGWIIKGFLPWKQVMHLGESQDLSHVFMHSYHL